MFKFIINTTLSVALLMSFAAPLFGDEAKLIEILKSDAKHSEKAEACRKLGQIGTKDAVQPLAALLTDEKLSHMARYALEPIDDPSVDTALLDALGKVKGKQLVGVIGSLGVRKYGKATESLAKLLKGDDPATTVAAARSLGCIGTPAAVEALKSALPTEPGAVRSAFCEGLFRCAEATEDKSKSAEIYNLILKLPKAPHQIRAAALRGTVLAEGEKGLPLLIETIRGDDFAMVQAAVRTAMEFKGSGVIKALADELGKLKPDKQIVLSRMFAERGDKAAIPAILQLAKKGDSKARLAAIMAIPGINDASALPVLSDLQKDPDKTIAAAAGNAMGSLDGKEVDAALANMLQSDDTPTKLAAIELIGRRRSANAVPVLMKTAGDKDETVRTKSLAVLNDLAGAAEFPALVQLLIKAQSASEINTIERGLTVICDREARPGAGVVVITRAEYGALPNGQKADVTKKVESLIKQGKMTIEASNTLFGDTAPGVPKKLRIDYKSKGVAKSETVRETGSIKLEVKGEPPAELVNALFAGLEKAPAGPKLALLQVLRSTGTPKALEAVRAATTTGDADFKSKAVSMLCNWPTVDALEDILKLARTSSDAKTKILAVRGAVNLIPQQQAPADKKLATVVEMFKLAERDEEKKLAVSALGSIPSAEALKLAMEHLENPTFREEAAIAAVEVAGKLGGKSAGVKEAMTKVSKTSRNRSTAKRARELMSK